MANNEYGPSVTAARLWEKTSAKGTTYLTGRMGNLRLTILPNNKRQNDDDPTHVMLLAEAPARDAGPRQSAPTSAPDLGGRFPD